MRRTARVLFLLTSLCGSVGAADGSAEEYINKIDERLFEWCLSYFPEPDEETTPIEQPKTLPPFSMEGVRAPPDLIKETIIIGKIPKAMRAYGGSWLLPWTGKSPFPYAAYVERLTPTEMTIAFLVKPLDGLKAYSANSLRHTLTWSGSDFSGKTENLFGLGGGLTFGVRISPSGDALALSFTDDREGHFLGCLVSSKHY